MARLSNAGMSRRGSSALAPVPEGRASTGTSREAVPPPPAIAAASDGDEASHHVVAATAGALQSHRWLCDLGNFDTEETSFGRWLPTHAPG